jgi:hypothetical protein
VFPVRYGLNSYILFRENAIFKGLNGLAPLTEMSRTKKCVCRPETYNTNIFETFLLIILVNTVFYLLSEIVVLR